MQQGHWGNQGHNPQYHDRSSYYLEQIEWDHHKRSSPGRWPGSQQAVKTTSMAPSGQQCYYKNHPYVGYTSPSSTQVLSYPQYQAPGMVSNYPVIQSQQTNGYPSNMPPPLPAGAKPPLPPLPPPEKTSSSMESAAYIKAAISSSISQIDSSNELPPPPPPPGKPLNRYVLCHEI